MISSRSSVQGSAKRILAFWNEKAEDKQQCPPFCVRRAHAEKQLTTLLITQPGDSSLFSDSIAITTSHAHWPSAFSNKAPAEDRKVIQETFDHDVCAGDMIWNAGGGGDGSSADSVARPLAAFY